MSSQIDTLQTMLGTCALAGICLTASATEPPSAVNLADVNTASVDTVCTLCSGYSDLRLIAAESVRRQTPEARVPALAVTVTRRGFEFTDTFSAESPNAQALRTLQFRDNHPLINRLKRLQAIPFVTLWDSTAATVYVGVNRDGEPGLHLRQKKQDRGTLLRHQHVLLVDNRATKATPVDPQVSAPAAP